MVAYSLVSVTADGGNKLLWLLVISFHFPIYLLVHHFLGKPHKTQTLSCPLLQQTVLVRKEIHITPTTESEFQMSNLLGSDLLCSMS